VKVLPYVALSLAAVVLGAIAFRAPEKDYVPPTAAAIEAHHPAPQSLPAEIPDGCTVRTIEVSGMCCLGCTGKLYERLRATSGFVEGAVSFEDGVARVVMSKDAEPAAFASALRFDKYEARLLP
jgi:hypothetical protein